jgi:hypothetical protein
VAVILSGIARDSRDVYSSKLSLVSEDYQWKMITGRNCLPRSLKIICERRLTRPGFPLPCPLPTQQIKAFSHPEIVYLFLLPAAGRRREKKLFISFSAQNQRKANSTPRLSFALPLAHPANQSLFLPGE